SSSGCELQIASREHGNTPSCSHTPNHTFECSHRTHWPLGRTRLMQIVGQPRGKRTSVSLHEDLEPDVVGTYQLVEAPRPSPRDDDQFVFEDFLLDKCGFISSAGDERYIEFRLEDLLPQQS